MQPSAAQFDVTVEFLLQMAAYLTEKHTSQLKAQMRKAATAHGSSSNAPSPVPGAEPAGYPAFQTAADAVRQAASGGARASSALSMRKDSPLPRNEPTAAAGPSTKFAPPTRPPASRNSSSGTAVLTQNQLAAKAAARSGEAQHRKVPPLGISTAHVTGVYAHEESLADSPSPVASTSSDSSSSASPVQSRIIRRPPRFLPAEGAGGLDDDEEEAEAAFLPFRPQREPAITSPSSAQDMGATLRGDVRDYSRRLPPDVSVKDQSIQSQTSDSSTSSAAIVSRRPTTSDRKPPGPLSPRRTAELAGRSPRGRGKVMSREGSDGTPSMGSSFSDLDGKLPPNHHGTLASHLLDTPRLHRCFGYTVCS